MKKIIKTHSIIIGIIVFLVIALFVIAFFTVRLYNKDRWIKYTNETYDFSFEHPYDAKVECNPEKDDVIILICTVRDKEKSFNKKFDQVFYLLKNPIDGSSMEEYVEAIYKGNIMGELVDRGINNMDAVRAYLEGTEDVPSPRVVYFLKVDRDKLLNIPAAWTYKSQGWLKYERFVSTFRSTHNIPDLVYE